MRIWKENGEDEVKNFKYKLPFGWHFCYRHAVDDHNNLRHAIPSIEDTRVTHMWQCMPEVCVHQPHGGNKNANQMEYFT